MPDCTYKQQNEEENNKNVNKRKTTTFFGRNILTIRIFKGRIVATNP